MYYMLMLLYIAIFHTTVYILHITYYCVYIPYYFVYSILLLFMSLYKYGTAQFKLDIYTCITLVLLDKFVGPLMSFT